MSSAASRPLPARRVSVAPMLDWTDTHCRFFHRLLSRNTWLYTEMVTTGALLHGDAARFLKYDTSEHPLALQLGGSEPDELARCAELAQRWGYDEINLNVGCPSERVQKGAFGACLMLEPDLVADLVRAMRRATDVPVTVKHRIGVDQQQDYATLRSFVETVAAAGCSTFIVHARNAILKGLSPKENREIPPLRPELVYRLKQELPELEIIINGGIVSFEQMDEHLRHVDGVMVGREAYHNPWWLSDVDRRYYGAVTAAPSREAVLDALAEYFAQRMAEGVPLARMTRHMLGLYQGLPGARTFRRLLSDTPRLRADGLAVLDMARAAVQARTPG